MLLSLALIILLGLVMARIFKGLGLAPIVGMLLTGIILGPSILGLLDEKILLISGELRQIALIIILIRAGLTLDIKDLVKAGRPAILLSFLPAVFEILAYGFFARLILGLDLINALLLGSVIAAVSPAVVVPRMVALIDKGYGRKKPIPQMILAGASCDDVFVLVIFSSLLAMAKGQGLSLKSLLDVPLSIGLGLVLGALLGYGLYRFFEFLYENSSHMRNSVKVIVMLGLSFGLMGLEALLKGKVPFSALLAIITMALVLGGKTEERVRVRLSQKFNKLWLFAEILLFVLLGAEVQIKFLTKTFVPGLALLFICLIVRSFGVVLSLGGSNLNKKERFFTVISYLPKATVQAAIGSVALDQGLESGMVILSMAVLSIIVTAPIGASLIDGTYKKLLEGPEEFDKNRLK